MKKFFAILAATAAVVLSMASCSKNGVAGGLAGTKWVASYSFTEAGITASANINLFFTATNFTMSASVSAAGYSEESPAITGTYAVSGSTITLTAKDQETGLGDSIQGTISGNKITFTGNDLGFNGTQSVVFTKQ